MQTKKLGFPTKRKRVVTVKYRNALRTATHCGDCPQRIADFGRI